MENTSFKLHFWLIETTSDYIYDGLFFLICLPVKNVGSKIHFKYSFMKCYFEVEWTSELTNAKIFWFFFFDRDLIPVEPLFCIAGFTYVIKIQILNLFITQFWRKLYLDHFSFEEFYIFMTFRKTFVFCNLLKVTFTRISVCYISLKLL